ncbi:hypothetical protein JW877_02305 [bacterium]|nr:hypothetical protein [bacterium]
MKVRRFILTSILLITLLVIDIYSWPIIGPATRMLNKGEIMLETHYNYQLFNRYYNLAEKEWIKLPSDSLYTINEIVTEFYWGIAREVSLRLILPVKLSQFGKDVNNGIGDGVFSLLYQPVRGEDEEQVGTVLWGGVRFPTGDSENFPPLGDNSYDFLVGLFDVRDFYGALYYTTVGLWLNGKNQDDEEIGVQYQYNFCLSVPVLKNSEPFVNIVGEFDGYFIGKFKENTRNQLCLGLQYVDIDHLVIEASVAVPIYSVGGYRYDFTPTAGFIFWF